MGRLFQPLQDMIGSLYDVLFDAATKAWALAKPIALVGLVIDLLTGKLGWVDSVLGAYNKFLAHTSGTSWFVLLLLVLVLMSLCKKD